MFLLYVLNITYLSGSKKRHYAKLNVKFDFNFVVFNFKLSVQKPNADISTVLA